AAADIWECSPRTVVQKAQEGRCRVIVSTYNEPLITSEWAAAIFEEAKKSGLLCAYVSNGHATRRALEFLRPWMSLYKVDLKCFDHGKYRDVTGGAMRHVLR
ncbi:MAG: AmmeMemoRadiSam system radical SAM enzyme, partial [Elusimicrobiota bacterium]